MTDPTLREVMLPVLNDAIGAGITRDDAFAVLALIGTDAAREARAEKKVREEQRIRADLDALIERVRDSEFPDRDVALGNLGQARGWLRPREEQKR